MGFADSAKLEEMEAQWKNRNESQEEPLEPGVYAMQLEGITLHEKDDGSWLTIWKHMVLEGEHQGEVATEFIGIDVGWKIDKRLINLGIEPPESVVDLEDIFGDLSNENPRYSTKITRSRSKTDPNRVFCNFEILEVFEESGTTPDPEPKRMNTPLPPVEESSILESDNVAWTEEGVDYTGIVQSLEADGMCVVKEENGNEWDLKLVNVNLVEGKLDELIAFAKSQDIKVTGMNEEEVIKEIKGWTYERSELDAEEIELLEEIGALKKAKAKKKAKKGKK